MTTSAISTNHANGAANNANRANYANNANNANRRYFEQDVHFTSLAISLQSTSL